MKIMTQFVSEFMFLYSLTILLQHLYLFAISATSRPYCPARLANPDFRKDATKAPVIFSGAIRSQVFESRKKDK
jgi:hypothetical protein